MQLIEKSKILFIINPNAGSGNIDHIIKSVRNNGVSYIITHSLNELDYVMSNEIEKYNVFVAVGGDGTVNSLAKYLINNEDKSLAILPTGSGNGFAREHGFRIDVEDLIQRISEGNTEKIDIVIINDNEFINVAGIGLDAEVAHRFHKSGRRGLILYIFNTIVCYRKFQPFNAVISNKNFALCGNFLMISIANTRQFGNNAVISPDSDPLDGQYEIVTVKPLSLLNAILFILKLFNGNLKDSKYINYYSCKNITNIKADFKKYHLDGNPLLSDGNYEIKIKKNALKVIQTTQIKP